jgi:hypothetical protein
MSILSVWQAQCVCDEGYSGVYCEAERDACADAACLHGGRCLPQRRAHRCDCSLTGTLLLKK